MSARETATAGNRPPVRYEIRVKGHLEPHWAAWFDGLCLTHAGDDSTLIHGHVSDQAALHGVLRKVRDLGLLLLSVEQIGPEQVPSDG